jgi:hypothetical protein
VTQGPNYYQAIIPDPQHRGTVFLATFDGGLLVYSASP